MRIILFVFILLSVFACDRNDRAGATGSGAGLYEERDSNGRQDATGGDDMNITTPIEEREEREER